MIKKTVAISLILAGLTLTGCGGAQTEKLIEAGNEAFAQQDYATALTEYQQAAVENPELAEPIYNAANVQYRQGEFEQTNATLQVALASADEGLAAVGYFNLGNTHFQTEQYAEAVDAYTESLRLNPHDMDAKVNLELALQKLQQEQQEQQQEEQEQNQDQQQQDQESQDEQNQDQQSQDEQNQEQQNQDQQNQDEQSQDEQDQEQNEQEQSQDNQDQQGQGEQDQEEDQQEQDQQSQDEQSQGEPEEEQEQQDEADPQNGEEEAEQPEEQQPQPGQAGGEPTDEEQDPTEMSLGELLEMDGLSEEQARQLLVAAAQGTETLQEYLQQMYVFPYSDVEQDW